MIIPFFITHAGCPHQCVFCNQKNITGQVLPENPDSIPVRIKTYLAASDSKEPAQVAFYGGSFTALPLETQRRYLDAVRPFIQAGQVRNIRLSTRPDYISGEVLSLLKNYHVAVVELGAQSMDDNVLAQSNRGHTAADTGKAAALLREQGFTLGLQLMPGLPGDSAKTFKKTIEAIIAIGPDFVRLYPVLVIRGTPLEKLYASGQYTPLTLDGAVSLCREAYEEFGNAGIQVIRMGLQPTDELQKPDRILAGPFHPAFRQLVESSMFLDKMRLALMSRSEVNATAVFQVDPRDISLAIGQGRANIEAIKNEFGLRRVYILGKNTSGKRGDAVLVPS